MLRLDIPPDSRPFAPDTTLLYYDGPLLFWLPHATPGFRYLAQALPETAEAPWPFLVTELTTTEGNALLSQQVTLRQATLSAAKHYFMPNYNDTQLVLQPLSLPLPEDWLPGDVTI